MYFNSTDFENLEVGTELLMVRYSQSPFPDYVKIKFKSFNTAKGLEYTFLNKSGKVMTKKTNKQKALYRIFIDENEMVKSLFECYIKRMIDTVPEEYHTLIEKSQHERPEIWI